VLAFLAEGKVVSGEYRLYYDRPKLSYENSLIECILTIHKLGFPLTERWA